MKRNTFSRFASAVAGTCLLCAGASAANPYLPLWEYIPDGEPYVFEDPDNPGKFRVYIYGSHDIEKTTYCGRDQVVWSAPVDDLRRWRFDGVIFESRLDATGAPLNADGKGDILYAPDVVETVAPDGKKTYYLYPNNQAAGRKGMIARADRPDGPFTVCNWSSSDPTRTDGVLGFDPAVFVDDDGRVDGYGGFKESWGGELYPGTMCTVRKGTQAVRDMVPSCNQDGVFRFFEASSIRKVKDKYIFVYSRWTADGDFGLPEANNTLAWAWSNSPLGPWTYGGTVIDARGRDVDEDGRPICTAAPGGNTHGSLCEVNGRWYVFYHRQTGLNEFSRQAMVGRVNVTVDERPGGKVSISEAEIDSMGFETEGLDPFELHAAGIASHYTGPVPARRRPRYAYSGPYPVPFRCDGYAAKNAYGPDVNRCALVNCTDGSVAGWKYFNFSKTAGKRGLKLLVELEPGGVDGVVDVWVKRPAANEGGLKVGSFRVTRDMPGGLQTVEVPIEALAAVKGREALYFTFSSPVKNRSICTLHSLRFRE